MSYGTSPYRLVVEHLVESTKVYGLLPSYTSIAEIDPREALPRS